MVSLESDQNSFTEPKQSEISSGKGIDVYQRMLEIENNAAVADMFVPSVEKARRVLEERGRNRATSAGVSSMLGLTDEKTLALDNLIDAISANNGTDFVIYKGNSPKYTGYFNTPIYTTALSEKTFSKLDSKSRLMSLSIPEFMDKGFDLEDCANMDKISDGEIRFADGKKVVFAPIKYLEPKLRDISNQEKKQQITEWFTEAYLDGGLKFDFIEQLAGSFGTQYVKLWKLANLDNKRISDKERVELVRELVDAGFDLTSKIREFNLSDFEKNPRKYYNLDKVLQENISEIATHYESFNQSESLELLIPNADVATINALTASLDAQPAFLEKQILELFPDNHCIFTTQYDGYIKEKNKAWLQKNKENEEKRQQKINKILEKIYQIKNTDGLAALFDQNFDKFKPNTTIEKLEYELEKTEKTKKISSQRTYFGNLLDRGLSRFIPEVELLLKCNKGNEDFEKEFNGCFESALKKAKAIEELQKHTVHPYDSARNFLELMYLQKQDVGQLYAAYIDAKKEFVEKFKEEPVFIAIEYDSVGSVYKTKESWGVRNPKLYLSNGHSVQKELNGLEKQVEAVTKHLWN